MSYATDSGLMFYFPPQPLPASLPYISVGGGSVLEVDRGP